MGPGHVAKLLGCVQADKLTEILNIALVGAAGTRVVEVGEPLDGGRYRGQALKFGGSQSAGAAICCSPAPPPTSSCLGIIEFLNRP